MLKGLGVDVVHLQDELPANTADPVLLRHIAGKDLVFVSGDRRMLAMFLSELKAANVMALFLGKYWKRIKLWDGAVWFVSRWPTMTKFAEGATRGTLAEVKQNGKCEPLHL